MLFKIFLAGAGRAPRDHRTTSGRFLALAFGLAVTVSGCSAFRARFPPANLQEAGWTLREGQAVWQSPGRKSEIAGELLVATKADGRALVQFTKSPFPLVIAQATPERWEVEFPPQHKRYAHRGNPPKRLIWLYLPRVLSGQPPPKNWTWREADSGWRLENHGNGEALEGYFNR